MAGGFEGAAAEYYARYRRGYPSAVVDCLSDALALTAADTVIDLGCGTGQLTLPLAQRVRVVVGVDPEEDMLSHAKAAASAAAVANVHWVHGSSDDLRTIAIRAGHVGAITVANAIHLIDRARLFSAAKEVLDPGRALAVIANGTPLWLQDTRWSQQLRAFMQRWLGVKPANHCGTDEATRSTYRRELAGADYDVEDIRADYSDTLSLEQVIGGVFSALSDRIPEGADQARFQTELRDALAGTEPFVEHVSVRALVAHRR